MTYDGRPMMKIRSRPVYVETEKGTISLVFEATARMRDGARPGIVGRPDVYVIDGDGVRLVRRGHRLVRSLLAGAVAYLLLWSVLRVYRAIGIDKG